MLLTLSNAELTRILMALVLLLASGHGVGYAFQKFKLPRVVGEIVGGALLGPSLLGYVFPDLHHWLFEGFEAEGKVLSFLSWVGLVLLMFISGFEIQSNISRKERRSIGMILAGATALPSLLGWFAPQFYDFSPYIGPANNTLALTIIIAIAVAVTSIPVISRIFLDLNILQTQFAKVVLGAATIQDVILWVGLAIGTGLIQQTGISAYEIIVSIIVTLSFFVVALAVMPSLVNRATPLRLNLIFKSSASGYVLLICLLFSAIAALLDVNVVFGAFLAGIVVGRVPHPQFENVKHSIKDFSLAFFIPLYFAMVGLRLDVIQDFDLAFFLGFLLFSSACEIVGTLAGARYAGYDWYGSWNFAVAMNTRGGPGIVLATVAYDLGIINEVFFTSLVVIAIVTSLLAGLWFRIALTKKSGLAGIRTL